jgi:hypothetical protein
MNPRQLAPCVLATLLLLPSLAAAQDPPEPQDPAAPADPQATEPPAQPTPEDQAAQYMEQQRAYMQEQLNRMYGPQAPQAPDTRDNAFYYLLKDGAKGPQLAADKPVMCYYRPGSSVMVRVQCDLEKRTCLVAESATFYDPAASASGEDKAKEQAPRSEAGRAPGTIETTLRPSFESEPPLLRGCAGVQYAEMFQVLINEGFTLTPALLDSPYGYKRDERGRAFQTHFDLRSRMLLGVYYTGQGLLDEYGSSLAIDTRSSYESWNHYSRKRHRFRFIEGQISLSPMNAQATVFEYDYGNTGDEPAFWITTLVGEPERYDVRMSLGAGLTLGRLDSRRYTTGSGDEARQTFIDLAEGRLNWELLQGTFLEDYLMVRVGGGAGTRTFQNEEAGGLYFYPEVGIKSAALIGERGLLQWQLDVRARQAWELGGASWRQLTATTSLEWVVLAISDQPLSLFVQPELHALDMPDEDIRQLDMRVMGGLRLSLFTPPPLNPAAPTADTSYAYGY